MIGQASGGDNPKNPEESRSFPKKPEEARGKPKKPEESVYTLLGHGGKGDKAVAALCCCIFAAVLLVVACVVVFWPGHGELASQQK